MMEFSSLSSELSVKTSIQVQSGLDLGSHLISTGSTELINGGDLGDSLTLEAGYPIRTIGGSELTGDGTQLEAIGRCFNLDCFGAVGDFRKDRLLYRQWGGRIREYSDCYVITLPASSVPRSGEKALTDVLDIISRQISLLQNPSDLNIKERAGDDAIYPVEEGLSYVRHVVYSFYTLYSKFEFTVKPSSSTAFLMDKLNERFL